MLLIALDRKDSRPAYAQIAQKIEALIKSGVIAAGEILPPTRRLARQLGVSRYTVSCAYQELWARGCLSSRPGSYSRVRGGSAHPAAGLAAREAAARKPGRPAPRAGAGCPIDLASYRLDEKLFPMKELRKALQRASADGNAALLQRGEPLGWMPLRRTIAARLRSHSVHAEPESILITNGALHGLDLCFRFFAAETGRAAGEKARPSGVAHLAARAAARASSQRPGGPPCIIVEEPTFSSALELCRLHGVTPVGMPLDAEGMDLGKLRAALGRKHPRFLFTIPTFHNPTGITTSPERREEILSLCREHGVPIVEDAFEEEISYFGRVVLPLKSMDRNGGVISLGTFSKVLFPGPRIGWITADEDSIGRLAAIKMTSGDGGSVLMQAALNDLCESGAYQRHLEMVNRISAGRMRAALDALSRYVPKDKASWIEPNGGFLIWLTIVSASLSEEELHTRLLSHGVDAAPGSGFFSAPSAQKRLHLRLSISARAEEEITEGIKRLGEVLEDV